MFRLHISKSKRTGKGTCTDLLDASFRKAGGPEKCGQELKKIFETLKTQINPVLCDAQTQPQHIHHFSDIRSLFSTLCPRETLQNLPCYCTKKTLNFYFILFIFISCCRQRLSMYLLLGENKVTCNEKGKIHGFFIFQKYDIF